MKKILCVCQAGQCRSVALARRIQSHGIPAVAIGVATSGSWFEVLCEEADKICLLDSSFLPHFERWKDKVVDFHVGPDRWVNPFHPELNEILEEMFLEKRTELGV